MLYAKQKKKKSLLSDDRGDFSFLMLMSIYASSSATFIMLVKVF